MKIEIDLKHLTARYPDVKTVCICSNCRKLYPFLEEAIKKEEEKLYEQDNLKNIHQ